MRISLFLILLFLSPLFAFSTSVSCSNKEYAGKQLIFETPADPVSGENKLCFELNFDAAGNSSAEINSTKTVYAFCDFGIYRGMLLLEPGKNIRLKLPPFRKKSFANQKNPYFSPVAFWFISEEKNKLTDHINGFEQKLNLLTDKHFNELYFKQSKTVWDSVLVQLNNEFLQTSPQAFVLHKKLREQLIEADILRLRPENYSTIFSGVKSEFWTHQAFITLLNKTFDGQLSFSAKSIKGKEVNTAVQQENTTALLKFIEKKYKLQGQIAELVLLKLLHDGFYSGDFSQTAVKNMVVSDLFMKNKNTLIKLTAQNIETKFTFLQKGSEAPAICLQNLERQQKCTNQNSEKFKYLVFADAETVVCREHLKYLSRINELFGKHLEIFVVLRDTEKQEIEKFFAENEIPAIKLLDKGNKFATKYKVRSYPQCHLFDEQHRVVFNNTKPPLDGFEQQFGTWLRNELFMRQRNQSR